MRLPTITEEYESEISSTLPSGKLSEFSTDESAISRSQDERNKSLSMHSKTFSIDSDASSYRCFKEIVMSNSSIITNPLHFFPILIDPGIQEAYDDIAMEILSLSDCDKYLEICKQLEICPISKVQKSLIKDQLNLKYYSPSEKQMKAICRVLQDNKCVQELNLQDNWLTPESCTYLAEVLEQNTTLKILELKECRIGSQGAAILSQGLAHCHISDLDLSFNSLGDDGLREIKDGLVDNIYLKKLNLSHNKITDEAIEDLHEIAYDALNLVELDLSWNIINSPRVMERLCKGLLENTSITRLNLAWNGIGLLEAIKPIRKFLNLSPALEYLDLSNNFLKGEPLALLMKGAYESKSLEHLKIGNNIFSPFEAYKCAQVLLNVKKRPFRILDMQNMVVKKSFLQLAHRIRDQNKEVIYGDVLGNWEIHGPYLPKVLFGRCKYLGLKPKKKKRRVDFGELITSLPDTPMAMKDFEELLKSKRLEKLLDPSLIAAVQNQYVIKKKNKIDCSKLVNDYLVLYPNTFSELLERKKNKKGKKQGTGKVKGAQKVKRGAKGAGKREKKLKISKVKKNKKKGKSEKKKKPKKVDTKGKKGGEKKAEDEKRDDDLLPLTREQLLKILSLEDDLTQFLPEEDINIGRNVGERRWSAETDSIAIAKRRLSRLEMSSTKTESKEKSLINRESSLTAGLIKSITSLQRSSLKEGSSSDAFRGRVLSKIDETEEIKDFAGDQRSADNNKDKNLTASKVFILDPTTTDEMSFAIKTDDSIIPRKVPSSTESNKGLVVDTTVSIQKKESLLKTSSNTDQNTLKRKSSSFTNMTNTRGGQKLDRVSFRNEKPLVLKKKSSSITTNMENAREAQKVSRVSFSR